MNSPDINAFAIQISGMGTMMLSANFGGALDSFSEAFGAPPDWKLGQKVTALIGFLVFCAGLYIKHKNDPTPMNLVTVTDTKTGLDTTIATVNPPGVTTAPTSASTAAPSAPPSVASPKG